MEKLLIQTLLKTPRIGSKSAMFVLEKYKGSINNINELHKAIIYARSINMRIPKIDLGVLKDSYKTSLEIFELSKKEGITILSENDDLYPDRYRSLEDKPLLIYVKGNLEALNYKNTVAVIGTRKISDFATVKGEEVTKRFVDNDFVIVSGLALGCDTVAHTSALKYGGITIAVLAGGLDNVSPKKNKSLADEILNNNGALISEYPIGTKPSKHYFVERDRLQSGLSDAVCILETSVKGGTMHTYSFAVKQNKLVCALKFPANKTTENSEGNSLLIKNNEVYPLDTNKDVDVFINKSKND
jgi:DNA protecting protein DprA